MHRKHYGAAIGHLFPSLLAIALFEVLSIRIYSNHTTNAALEFPIWICSQALGGLLFGYLSDRYCRRKTFIITLFLGLVCSALVLRRGFDGATIAILGFLFNPTPVARAALVDNFPRESKLPLISSTFVAQFLPWCFFIPIAHLSNHYAILFLIALLLINLLLTVLYFQDRRDLTRDHEKWNEGFKSSRSVKRVILTLVALIPVEIAFFVSDTFIEKLTLNESFFTALGLGTLIGTLMSFFYRKTPHISVITTCYGIGFVFTLLSSLLYYILPFDELNLNYQIMIFSVLGGFYLPFVYDSMLSSVSPNFRGTTCGTIELFISISAMLGLGIVLFFQPTQPTILLLITLLYLTATITQKKAENPTY